MFRELLKAEFAPYKDLSETQLSELEQHFELTMRWNAKLNLTRITKLEEVVKLHYCESLYLGTLLPSGPLKIADIGSGAGFPGIPIAILRPECSVTLIDSHHRKSVFLREASRSLSNVRVVASLAEDVREKFDWMVSRAVARAEIEKLWLAPDVALLSSGDEGQRVPWGERRVALMFHVEHRSDVPRGT
jgi:16S rRNA G527 N7-methylase RsmG